MPDPTRVPAGALAPLELTYVLRSERIDLSKATSARFVLRRNKGQAPDEEWSAVIRDKSPRCLTLAHLFVAGDVPDPDDIVFEPRVLTSLGPGEVVGRTRTLVVFDHPAVQR